MFPEVAFNLPAQLCLGHALLQDARDPFQHGMVQCKGFPEGFLLFRILVESQLFHQTIAGLKRPGCGQGAGQFRIHAAGFESYTCAALGQNLLQRLDKVPVVDDKALFRPELPGGILVPGVRDEIVLA